MIALTDRQRAVLRAALEARSGRELTPTEQRELGEALAGHLELASAWGAAACSDAEASEWWAERARLAESYGDAAIRERDAANTRADEWATRCRAAGEAHDVALLERNGWAQRADVQQRRAEAAEDRIAELERELAALRQAAPAEPARVPVAAGQLRLDGERAWSVRGEYVHSPGWWLVACRAEVRSLREAELATWPLVTDHARGEGP